MKMKKLVVAALAAAITVGSALPASAAWVASGSDWKFQNEDGSWQTGKWFQDADGKWYHFNEAGIAQKGWFQDAGSKWYFFAYNGIMQTGVIKVDNKVYYMNEDGSLFSGNKKVYGAEYNFTENGTTNGAPYVVASQTFGGNGNQTDVILGGGGYSSSSLGGSSSGGGRTQEPSKITVVKKAIKDEFDNIPANDTIDKVNVDGNKIKFTYKDSVKGPTTLVSDTSFVDDVQDALTKVLEDEDVAEVNVGHRTFTKDNADDFKTLVNTLGYGDKTVGEVIGLLKVRGIKVITSGGDEINYSVSGK